MKKLVLTISIGHKYLEIASITHNYIKRYADKIGAEFMAITDQKHSSPHWEKFRIYDLFNSYDRILYIDTDVLISHDCPDLFKVCPRYAMGAFNEGLYFERKRKDYYNTGVMVIPSEYKEIFKNPEHENGNINTFFEQDFLNDRIHHSGLAVFNLSHKFNKMDFINAPGYIIHKAGNLNAYQELRELSGVMA